MEYKKVKIGEIADVIPGFAFKGKDFGNVGEKVIKITDIKPPTIDLKNCNKIDIKKYDVEKLQKFLAKKGDYIIAMTGATIGKIGKIMVDDYAYLNQRTAKFEPKDNINKDYLYYCLMQNSFAKYITSHVDSDSAQPNISGNTISQYELMLPSISNQNKTTTILSNIDKKIELNKQINNNLFKLAINYINNKTEEVEVPINKFAKIQGGYAFKSKDLLDDKTDNRIIKIKNLRNEINADVLNSQYVKDEVANNIDIKFKLNKGDVAIAMTGAELGKTGFIYGFDKYYLNQRVGVIRGKNKQGELYLKLLFLSNEFQTLLNSKGYGSAQPNISTNDIESILIKDITEDNLKEIYERLNSVYYKIISNFEENLNLEQLRDTLLPRLMNGEIDLDKIEI